MARFPDYRHSTNSSMLGEMNTGSIRRAPGCAYRRATAMRPSPPMAAFCGPNKGICNRASICPMNVRFGSKPDIQRPGHLCPLLGVKRTSPRATPVNESMTQAPPWGVLTAVGGRLVGPTETTGNTWIAPGESVWPDKAGRAACGTAAGVGQIQSKRYTIP